MGHDTVRDTDIDIDIDIDVDGHGDGVMRAAEGDGSGGVKKNQPGGSGGGSGSTDSSSAGNTTSFNGSRTRQLASRRDVVAQQQRPQPQPTEQGGDRCIVRTRWGGWREVERGTSTVAEANCRNSSRTVVAAKSGRQQKSVVDTMGGTGGDGDGNEQYITVLKSKKELCSVRSGELCHRRGRGRRLLCTWSEYVLWVECTCCPGAIWALRDFDVL